MRLPETRVLPYLHESVILVSSKGLAGQKDQRLEEMLDWFGLTLNLLESLGQIVKLSHPEVLLLQSLDVSGVIKFCLTQVFVHQGDHVVTGWLVRKDSLELQQSSLHQGNALLAITVLSKISSQFIDSWYHD